MQKINLTGHTGFLGSELYSELSKTFEIYTIGRNLNSNFIYDFENITNQIPFCDIFIHCAGIAHKKFTEKDYLFSINSTNVLLESITKSKTFPNDFVFISSVSVYGKAFGENINEDYELQAIDYYGKSKIISENIIINWALKYNIKYTILRLPLVVGNNPPGNLKKMINGIKHGYYFNIDSGTTKRSMVLASDVARFLIAASSVGGIYNLTDGYHPSYYELSLKYAEKYNKKVFNIPKKLICPVAKMGDIFPSIFPLDSIKLDKMTKSLTFDDKKARKYFFWSPLNVLENI